MTSGRSAELRSMIALPVEVCRASIFTTLPGMPTTVECCGMDLDPGEEAADVAHEPRQRGKLPLPNPVRQPVDKDRVKTGISNCHFPRRPRRRIALENRLDIFFKRFPHDRRFGEMECWSTGVMGQDTPPNTPSF